MQHSTRRILAVTHAIGAMFSAKYTTPEGTQQVVLDLEDQKPPLVGDLSTLKPEVVTQIAMFGLRTLMRNATAGKIEDLTDGKARQAVEQRLATFASGKFVAEGDAKAKLELTDAEKSEVIRNVIVMAKKAKGDVRAEADIIIAFNGLSPEQKQAIVASLQKVIDKQIKQKLREKKSVAKGAENAQLGSF